MEKSWLKIPARTCKTTRRKEALICPQNHIYTFNKLRGNRKYWTCQFSRKQHCKAKMMTKTENPEFMYVEEPSVHNHLSNIARLNCKLREDEIIKKAVENPSLKPRRVLAELNEANVLASESLF